MDESLAGELDWLDPRLARKRVRTIPYPGTVQIGQSRNGLTMQEDPPVILPLDGNQVDIELCEDTIRNPDYYQVFFDRPLDDGGPLTIFRSAYRRNAANISSPWIHNRRTSGAVTVLRPNRSHEGGDVWRSKTPWLADLEVEDTGTKLWKLSRPAQPLAGLALFIAEAKDIPRLLISKLRTIKDLADWYLALTFGWEPLLRDIMDFWNSIIHVHEQVQFLIRNNGKQLHRFMRFPLNTVSSVLDEDLGVNGLILNTAVAYGKPNAYNQHGYSRVTFSKDQEAWFSGMFVYYLKDASDPFEATPEEVKRLQALLFGAKVTPNVVWEALPWSWLVDYFVNVGDILTNFSAEVADRQLTTHAYVMQKTIRKYTQEGSDGYEHASASITYTTLARRKADPYGLSSSISLSDKQTSILLALGLSRVK